MNSKTTISDVRPAGMNAFGEEHQVVTVTGGNGSYRRTPCAKCPWRKDAVGEFPADAFRHSANTAYDMSTKTFGCHESGHIKPAICAGFLLRGADHNLKVRMMQIEQGGLNVKENGLELHENYREMAISNGVDREDPVLKPCRD
ncbi:DUF6283 family protein [Comamonas testosteroni]|uniref:DUF6283 family protein n=1 Tax=Comamonas testosteroni TaxID=285 RepID=UPI0005B35170|nr:DUF6283 family protein [Comamonas testosteroni]